MSSCYKPSVLPETPINVITLPGSFFLFKSVFYYLHLDRLGFVSRTEWRCALACVCVGRKSVCGGAAFFFPKRRGLVHPQHPVPTSLKMEKRSFARCWEYRLNAKQVPIRGRRKGQQECRNADINSPSGKTWWVIDQCSFCSCSQKESQPLDVAFSCNCLVGGDEEVDTARKQTGSTPWKKVFFRG